MLWCEPKIHAVMPGRLSHATSLPKNTLFRSPYKPCCEPNLQTFSRDRSAVATRLPEYDRKLETTKASFSWGGKPRFGGLQVILHCQPEEKLGAHQSEVHPERHQLYSDSTLAIKLPLVGSNPEASQSEVCE